MAPRDATVKAIEAALERAPDINLHRYPIEIERVGEAIRLRGRVEHIAAKRKALRLARRAASTDAIVDRLSLDVGAERGERALRQAVVEMLKGEPAFSELPIVEGTERPPDARPHWIGVATEGDRVVLAGTVGSLSHRRLAEVIAWWVPGSADVDDRIRLDPPEADTDDELADAVRLVLEKDPAVDARQIDITVRDAEVTLSGAANGDGQRERAVLDCWYVAGVHGVGDRLAVKTP